MVVSKMAPKSKRTKNGLSLKLAREKKTCWKKVRSENLCSIRSLPSYHLISLSLPFSHSLSPSFLRTCVRMHTYTRIYSRKIALTNTLNTLLLSQSICTISLLLSQKEHLNYIKLQHHSTLTNFSKNSGLKVFT